jgi:terminase small subunit / prophage DNA-packing protein
LKNVMNRSQLAELLAVNLTTVDNWVREGCPFVKRPVRAGVGNWEFSPAAVVQWRIDRERQSALGDLAKVDEAEARRRKMAAEAGLAELELQIKNGNAVAIADQERIWVQMVGSARARLLAIPTKVGPSVAIEADAVACQSMIEAAITEALSELAGFDPNAVEELEDEPGAEGVSVEPGRIAEPARGSAQDGVDLGAAAETDHKRVGRPRKKALPRK